MKKLTSEQRKVLQSCLAKLEKADANDAKMLKEQLDDIMNDFADVSNSLNVKEGLTGSEKDKNAKVKKVIVREEESQRQNHSFDNDLQKIVDRFEEKDSYDELEENFNAKQDRIEQAKQRYKDLGIIDNELFVDTLKTCIDLNQKCIDYSIILLENSDSASAKQIKKCIDGNTEAKRRLKNVYKSLIEQL